MKDLQAHSTRKDVYRYTNDTSEDVLLTSVIRDTNQSYRTIELLNNKTK